MKNERTDLYYQQGGSDKVYIVAMTEQQPGLFDVTCYYGRRGSTLNKALKTATPLGWGRAMGVFSHCVREKVKKGYQQSSSPLASIPGLGASSSKVSQPTANSGPKLVSDILPQLLNPVRDEEEVERLLADANWWAQEKMDGERRMATNEGDVWRGINKKGNVVDLPAVVELDLSWVPAGSTLDGEIIGDVYYVFDVLRWSGYSLTDLTLESRITRLEGFKETPNVRLVPYHTGVNKRALLEKVKANGGEGVVWKHCVSSYTPGRPNSGGDQLKFKFVESATVFVTKVSSTKRSVAFAGLDDDGKVHDLGNVKIPTNHEIPSKGDIVEVRYLHAYKGGALYQPVYLGKRNDQGTDDCRLSQLKYKSLTLNAGSQPEGDARWAW